MKTSRILVLASLLVGASAPYAGEWNSDYFEITSVEIQDITAQAQYQTPSLSTLSVLIAESAKTRPSAKPRTLPAKKKPSRNTTIPALDKADLVLDKVINMGKKIWTIVEAGKPIVSTEWSSANALPEGAKLWTEMDGWQNPVSRVYRVHAKNLYGVTVIDFSYRITYTYGGSHKGVGRYLTAVSARAEHLSVAWGYVFDGAVEIPSVANMGTVANPIAGMELIVKWKIKTPLKESQSSAAYHIRGDGNFQEL